MMSKPGNLNFIVSFTKTDSFFPVNSAISRTKITTENIHLLKRFYHKKSNFLSFDQASCQPLFLLIKHDIEAEYRNRYNTSGQTSPWVF